MANIRSNERVSVSRSSSPAPVPRQGTSRSTQIQQRESAPVVETWQGGGGGYQESWGGEGVSSQQWEQGPYVDLDEAASSDMGSLARNEEPASQMTAQSEPRQEAAQAPRQAMAAQTSGLAPSGAAATPAPNRESLSSRVPVVDMSPIGGMPVMSSRRPRFDETTLDEVSEAPAESGSQLRATRVTGNEKATPSVTSERTDETTAKPSVLETALRGGATASSTETSSKQVEQTTFDRPDSVFNRPVGYDPKSRAPRMKRPSTKRPGAVKDAMKNAAANAFKRSGVGYRIYGKMVANANLDLREVGVGYQEISAVVEQDPKMLNDLLFASTGEQVDVTTWSMNDIRQYINNHDIYVGTFKPPNNRGQDVQRRKLRVMDSQRRGIFLHPFMAAMYTADFDGDDMEVSLSPQVAELTKDPMDYMIGIDGKQSLNTDFLPVAELVDGYEDDKTVRDFVREVMFDGFADGRTISFLVDSVIDLGKTAMQDGDAQAVAWADVFAEARAVADRISNGDVVTSNDTMSWLCKRVFDTMHRVRVNNTLMTMGAERLENLPSPKNYDDMAIYKIVDDMVEGRIPNNFQELKIMLSGYIGNVKGKNAPFRFTADVGKMMKMDSRIQVGDGSFQVDPDNAEQMTAFFESTIKFVESRRMAKEIKQAGRSKYYTQVMRDLVIKEVKFPENYENYSDFLDAFVKSYAKHSSIINESNLVYLSNMGIASDSNRGLVSPLNPSKGGIRFSDIAEPMLSIYGTYSVGKMFDSLSTSGIMSDRSTDSRWKGTPGHVTKLRKGGDDASSPFEREYEFSGTEFWVNGKYLNYNLRQFRDENRLLRDKERTKKVQAMRLRDAERMTNSEKELWMLLAIADKKTGAASKFNKYVYGFMSKSDDSDEDVSSSRGKTGDNEKNDVQMLSDLLVELERLDTDGTVSGRRDQMQWVNDVVETMIASGPDMFSYFDMDSTAGFLKSKWAKKMMEHRNDVEVLGGIRTSMVFEYRMERINALLADMPSPNDERYPSAYNKLELAKDELAASSETWRAIIKEMIAEATPGEESVFSQLASGKVLKKTSVSGEEYEWVGRNLFNKTREFWKNPGNHTTLRSVIEDTDLDRETKWNVIADVVRYWENDAYFKSWEVGYQLEIGSDSSYSLMSGPGQSMTKMHRDFEKAFNKWGRMSQQKLQEEVDEAAKKYNNARNKGALMNTLKRLDSHPWERIEIDDDMYADAIMSVLDKQYAQTEKASQHPWTNALYAALSFQQNGEYMNDITRTDDRLVGIQSAESVDIGDVVHLLADPEAELWVYDEYGGRCMLTRDIILQNSLNREVSNDVEADVWEFLQKNPRIASAIRRHNACVSASSDGTGYVGAALSLSETIGRSNDPDSPINHVKYLMRDHPIYAGIISMASPKRGKVARNERTRTVEIENYLARQIYSYASSETSASGAAAAILSDMGITQESIRDAMRSDYDKFLDEMGLPRADRYEVTESDSDANFTYVVVSSNLARYIHEVRSQVELGRPLSNEASKPEMGVDVESVASFWDVLQELGGAKTAVSTGIEGAETYQYAMWASHVTARDSYADLEAVFEDVNDQSWDGMWTNLVGPDGTPLVLQVDENGNITNYRQLVRAKKEQGVDEIVTAVPEGYQVRDRSTDSHGTPVSSLFAYMVSKRSNGAEAFNLKAKKAGLDGKDSITKMRGKYRMTDDGRGGQVRANFFDTQWDLQQTAQHEGLPAAKMQLAQMLMQENETLGYDDLTLSNYMSIADLMLIEGEDGVVRLRTLEMLFSAIKHRLGSRVDEMSDAEIRQAADAIVNDRGENGIGMETMDSLDALMGIQPKSKASSFSGIRMASSVFERNYDLLSKIAEKASSEGIMPFSQRKAASMTEAYVDKKKGVRGVREVIDRSEATRNYSVVGFAGAFENAEEINWTIGPSNAVVIGDGSVSDEDVARICDRAYELGMTVVVSSEHRDKIPSEYLPDAMPISVQGDVIIPCFDMRLNGSEASPYDGGQFSIFQAPFSRYVTSVEDSINEYMLGDAQYKPTKALVDRIKIVDNGSKAIKAEDLFPNVFRNPDFKGCTFAVSLLNGNELSRIVANGFECSIDYGVVEGGNGFDQRKHDVDKAIDRYISRWSEANADGMMMDDCAPGDIVAWAEVEIQNPLTGSASQYVLAPIIPFQLHGPTKNVPESFSVAQVGYVDDDNTLFTVDWTNTTDISNGFAKYFDSSGGANKGMIDFTDAIRADLRLVDGTSVDAYCARESTDSRKIGTDRRIKTMISLMAKARMNGYNFARVDGSFPNMPQIREQMLSGDRVPRSVWGPLLEWDGPVFCEDPQLDAFLKFECRKVYDNGGNPTDYLMSVYEDENGKEVNTHVMWEFEAMFEQGLNYEDMLLRFLHTMDPTFCPSGMEDDGEYLFRLQRDGADLAHDYDAGVLQMQVPHRMSTGEVRYLWENVYIGMSFFGEDYSGFSRPNVDGASNFLDAMNTMSYYGMELDEKAARFRAMWATADIGRLPKDGGAIGKAPREE